MTTASTARRSLRIFLSSADSDRKVVQDLWDRLATALKPSETLDVTCFRYDQQLLPGEDFDARMRDELDQADMGVFAITAAMLESPYVRDVELTAFLPTPDGKWLFPLLACPVPRSVGLLGLRERQISGWGSPYSGCKGTHAKTVWVNRVADEIDGVADRYGLGT